MGYTNKYFVKLMNWMYVRYGQIKPGDLIRNHEQIQVTYNVEDTIEILFDQIETGQKIAVVGTSPFSDSHIADMGVAKILVTQEYTHAYCMWKIIAADNCTCVRLKFNFQEAHLEIEQLEQTAGAPGYGSVNSIKNGEIQDAFMDFESATASRDSAFTKITTTNFNLSTQLRQHKDQIRSLRSKLCNLKVAAAIKNVEGETNNSAPPYVQDKRQ